MNELIFYLIIIATIFLSNLFAFLRKKEVNVLTYTADPDSHNGFYVTFSMVGTIVGGGMFLAVGQIGYEAGILGYIFGFATMIGLIITGLFCEKFREIMDAEGADTLIELIEKRFSKRVAVFFSGVCGFMYFVLLAAQFRALYTFGVYMQDVLSVSYVWYLVSFGVISMLIYPVFGGLRKDIVSDVFQVSLVGVAALILMFYYFSYSGSIAMWKTLPTEHLTGTGYGTVMLLGVLIFLPGLFLVRMDVWQRIRTSKSSKIASRSFFVSGVISLLFYVIFTTMGIWAFHLNSNDAANATLYAINYAVANPIILGVIFGSFFAAVMSSADTFINNVSLFSVSILYRKDWSDFVVDGESKNLLKRIRFISLIIVIISAFMSWSFDDYVDLLVGAFSLILMFLPTIIGTFLENWRSEKSAFYSALSGLVVFLIGFFAWSPKLAFAPGVLISFFVYWLLCATKPSLEKV